MLASNEVKRIVWKVQISNSQMDGSSLVNVISNGSNARIPTYRFFFFLFDRKLLGGFLWAARPQSRRKFEFVIVPNSTAIVLEFFALIGGQVWNPKQIKQSAVWNSKESLLVGANAQWWVFDLWASGL